MSRITPPVSRIAQISAGRSITGHSTSSRHANMAFYRNLREAKMDKTSNNKLTDRLPNIELMGSQSTQGLHTVHRPTVSSTYKIVPLMQGFQNSAPKHAFHGLSTIDSHTMPFLTNPPPPPSKLRVPLLPDNYSPDRTSKFGHGLEASDDPFLKPQINIVAHNSEYRTPVPIGEVAFSQELDS